VLRARGDSPRITPSIFQESVVRSRASDWNLIENIARVDSSCGQNAETFLLDRLLRR
jgi:hypothetical protein